MTQEKDIVADIIDRAAAAVREYLGSSMGFEEQVIDVICQQIRAQERPARRYWGGANPYVAVQPRDKHEAKQRALEEAQRTGRIAEAADRHGISRATMYRMLKR